MEAGKGARKALARALSRVVLSRETILVHAESVLERADLIEGSLHSAAFNLWFAVLQRAEAEGAVERLVASVLEDNPGAEPLREALRGWQQAAASEARAARGELATPEGAEKTTGGVWPERGERARWLALGVVALGFTVLFSVRALRKPVDPEAAPRRAPQPALWSAPAAVAPAPASPVQVGAALRARVRTSAAADAGNGDTQNEPAGGGVQKRGR
jgi:hypothetical protein